MLEDLDAGEQIVLTIDGIRDGADTAEALYVRAHVLNSPGGNIPAVCLYSTVPERFDEQTQRATCVKHGLRSKSTLQLVCNPAKEIQPMIVALIWNRAAMGRIVGCAVKLFPGRANLN